MGMEINSILLQRRGALNGNLYSLALTGGIACGKSTVGAILESLGLVRVDSDQIARDLVRPGTAALEEIVERFGTTVLLADGCLDRPALGRIVFSDSAARKDLERILHPKIWAVMGAHMERAAGLAQETVFEIPLLFENGNEGRFGEVWVVAVTPETQLRRLMARDGVGQEQAQARLDSQMSVQEKARRATFVISNDGDRENLQTQIREGLRRWRESRTERIGAPAESEGQA